MYNSLAHLVWKRMIETKANAGIFNPFDAFHWISITALAISSLNLVVLCLLYIRYKSINLLLLSLPKTHGLQDFIFSTVSTVSPATFSLTEIWQSFQDLISDVWSLEFILILILLLLIGVTAVHFYSIRQKTSKFHTKIRLDLHVNGLDCQCEMLNLKYPANYYTIDIHPAEFKINGGLFLRLYFEGAIKITDSAGQPVDFNNSISIPYWTRNLCYSKDDRAMRAI